MVQAKCKQCIESNNLNFPFRTVRVREFQFGTPARYVHNIYSAHAWGHSPRTQQNLRTGLNGSGDAKINLDLGTQYPEKSLISAARAISDHYSSALPNANPTVILNCLEKLTNILYFAQCYSSLELIIIS